MTSIVSRVMHRRGAERVATEEPEDINTEALNRNNSLVDEEGEEGQFVGRTPAADNLAVAAGNEENSQRVPMLETEAEAVTDGVENGEAAGTESTNGTRRSSSRRRTYRGLTLRDLEEEREIVQRRTGGCVLISSFILLRLWIQALMTGDFGLLILCLVFTSWTAKFVRYTRDREEELNRMINEWNENADDEPSGISDSNLRSMSFQSQLALAIMQSQIQMMEGGYGHPDGGENKPGVGDEIRKTWNMFDFKSPTSHGNLFGSDGGKTLDEEEPTCSVCLCEYEKGDNLIMLPCKHVFHEDCIKSWTDNNLRCPLCNADLTEMTGNEVV